MPRQNGMVLRLMQWNLPWILTVNHPKKYMIADKKIKRRAKLFDITVLMDE